MASGIKVPPPPLTTQDKSVWASWYIAIKDAINNLTLSLKWTLLDFTGSNITDVTTRSHQDLQNLQGGSSTERYHITSTQATAIASFNSTQWTDLTDGGGTTLHTHTHNSNTSMQGGTAGEYYHLTSAQLTGLTGGGSTSLHHHGGLSVTITTAPITGGGATGSMTFTNGILTAQTQAT